MHIEKNILLLNIDLRLHLPVDIQWVQCGRCVAGQWHIHHLDRSHVYQPLASRTHVNVPHIYNQPLASWPMHIQWTGVLGISIHSGPVRCGRPTVCGWPGDANDQSQVCQQLSQCIFTWTGLVLGIPNTTGQSMWESTQFVAGQCIFNGQALVPGI